jgi:hypothetical protein
MIEICGIAGLRQVQAECWLDSFRTGFIHAIQSGFRLLNFNAMVHINGMERRAKPAEQLTNHVPG